MDSFVCEIDDRISSLKKRMHLLIDTEFNTPRQMLWECATGHLLDSDLSNL